MITENTSEGGRGFVEMLNGAIRENPVSAGLVGLGIVWMFLGNAKGASLANGLLGAPAQAADAVRTAAAGMGAAASETVGTVDEAMRQSREAVASGAEQVAAAVTSAEQKASRAATEFGRDMGQSIQNNVILTVDRQPLLLGLIGVGVGAGIASLFPSTIVEQELVGSTASTVMDEFHDIATQAGHRAENAFDAMRREATVQGFTSEFASDSINGVAEKLKSTTTVAKESILTTGL